MFPPLPPVLSSVESIDDAELTRLRAEAEAEQQRWKGIEQQKQDTEEQRQMEIERQKRETERQRLDAELQKQLETEQQKQEAERQKQETERQRRMEIVRQRQEAERQKQEAERQRRMEIERQRLEEERRNKRIIGVYYHTSYGGMLTARLRIDDGRAVCDYRCTVCGYAIITYTARVDGNTVSLIGRAKRGDHCTFHEYDLVENYNGTINDSGTVLTGFWYKNGESVPITFYKQ
jgi:hypothetical protein